MTYINDKNTIMVICSAVANNNPDLMMQALPSNDGSDFILYVDGRDFYLRNMCVAKKAMACLKRLVDNMNSDTIFDTFLDVFKGINKSKDDLGYKGILKVLLSSKNALSRENYDRIKDIRSNTIDSDFISMAIRCECLKSMIINADATVLLDEFFSAPVSIFWKESKLIIDIFERIAAKKQDLTDYDNKNHLLHKVITFNPPILNENILRMLLRNNCDPNQQGKYAVLIDLAYSFYNNENLYKILIKAGCDKNCKNADGHTVLEIIGFLWGRVEDRISISKNIRSNQ